MAHVEFDAERDAALRSSANCAHGCSEGLATVYRKDRQMFSVRTKDGRLVEVESVVMTCTCEIGRWLVRKWSGRPPWDDLEAQRRGVVTHGEVMVAQARAAGLPDDDGSTDARPVTRAMINEMFKRSEPAA